jgi:hypothetical protein
MKKNKAESRNSQSHKNREMKLKDQKKESKIRIRGSIKMRQNWKNIVKQAHKYRINRRGYWAKKYGSAT